MNDDTQSIERLIRAWALWRDTRQWDLLRTCYWPGARVRTTWLDGTAEDFIEVAAVGRQRVRRHLSLTAQVFAVSVQLSFHAQRTERSELLTRGSTRPMTSAM